MSIATREAAELYPLKDSFTEHGNERTNLRREGYVAGRTAPVTEEEIEAAAMAGRWHFVDEDEDEEPIHEHSFFCYSCPNIRGTWDEVDHHCVEQMLAAARKQVSDE